MTEIPEQLKKEGFRFIKLRFNDKRPEELEWQKDVNYSYDDPKILNHNGNYGVATGFNNLLVLDFDDVDAWEDLKDILPKTFAVKTAIKGMPHLYYFCEDTTSFVIKNKVGKSVIDGQGKGKQVVGAGSIINTKTYSIYQDLEIVNLPLKTLKQIKKKYEVKEKKEVKDQNANLKKLSEEDKEIVEKANLKEYLTKFGFNTKKNPTKCIWHETTGKGNFSFNNTKRVWHCFNCEEEGNVIHLVMKFYGITKHKARNILKKELNIQTQETAKIKDKSDMRDELEKQIIEIFPDENNDVWAYYNDEEEKRLSKVESIEFKDFTRLQVNEATDDLKEHWIEALVKLFASKGRRNKEQRRKLYLRTASKNGKWIIQINQEEMFQIDETGGEIVEFKPIFKIYSNQKPFQYDSNATIEDLNLIEKYIPFKDKSEIELFKNTIPAYMIPNIEKPIILSRGPPGSAKSTFSRLITMILNPSNTNQDGKDFPEKDDDFFVQCNSNFVQFYDNLSYLSKEQQDKCCRLVTGFDIERRKLYTDSETITANIKTILILNAIDLTNLNSDFIDRAFIFELNSILPEERKEKGIFFLELEKDLPKIRGAILKILTKAFELKDSIPKDKIPAMRLKDFGKYCTAIALARGQDLETFNQQIQTKLDLQKDETIEQSPIIHPLIKFMEHKIEWKGTAKTLLDELTKQEFGVIEQWGENERIIAKNIPKNWIKTHQKLGTELTKVINFVQRVNLKIEKGDHLRGPNGERFIKILKVLPNPLSELSET